MTRRTLDVKEFVRTLDREFLDDFHDLDGGIIIVTPTGEGQALVQTETLQALVQTETLQALIQTGTGV